MNHLIETLPVLVIYAHTRCNCRCVMCDIWKTAEHREFTVAQLEAQLPAMERLKVRWVVFSGGEPLMHSDLFALTRPLRARGIRVTILTTGLLLERFAAQVVQHVDDVIVSLDGSDEIHDRIRRVPGTFQAIARGVEALHALAPEYRVTARCTVQKENHESLVATAEAARNLGLASISFLAADMASSAFGRDRLLKNPDKSQETQAEGLCHDSERGTGVQPVFRGYADSISLTASEIPTLAAQIEALKRDPFVADSTNHLDRIVEHFEAHLGTREHLAPRCNAPWVSAVMETDGGVRPCFFHPLIGNGRLDQALNGPVAVDFRSRLDVASNPTCRKCVCSLHLSPSP